MLRRSGVASTVLAALRLSSPLRRLFAVVVLACGSLVATSGHAAAAAPGPFVGVAATPDGRGYWLAASDGGVFSYGDAAFLGSAAGVALSRPVVGIAATPDGDGYWLVAADGGVFSFGDAPFSGSMAGVSLHAPVVGMAATPDGRGYWLVAADGGVFSFGTARFFGSLPALQRSHAVVGIAPTPDGLGYWLAAADGGVFAFGDARFLGSTGGRQLNGPVVGIAAALDGLGYWLVAADGGVFSFGDADYLGSPGPTPPDTPVVALAAGSDEPHSSGVAGYWLLGSGGTVAAFGDATWLGDATSANRLRVALYGDSLSWEAEDFVEFIGASSGYIVQDAARGGTAICDVLPVMSTDAATWRPQVALVQFSGNALTPCMAGITAGSPEYFAKYRSDAEAAINILEGGGAHVLLVGAPPASTAEGSRNLTQINAIYADLASHDPRVTYVDAGEAVTDNGAFTSTLPCLSFEPCLGPDGTNIVRAPDGVHFCPTGFASGPDNGACPVYSSGAFRYASAMLQAVSVTATAG